jgi:hypothetical protein
MCSALIGTFVQNLRLLQLRKFRMCGPDVDQMRMTTMSV